MIAKMRAEVANEEWPWKKSGRDDDDDNSTLIALLLFHTCGKFRNGDDNEKILKKIGDQKNLNEILEHLRDPLTALGLQFSNDPSEFTAKKNIMDDEQMKCFLRSGVVDKEVIHFLLRSGIFSCKISNQRRAPTCFKSLQTDHKMYHVIDPKVLTLLQDDGDALVAKINRGTCRYMISCGTFKTIPKQKNQMHLDPLSDRAREREKAYIVDDASQTHVTHVPHEIHETHDTLKTHEIHET